MDDHIRKLNTRISNKEAELNLKIGRRDSNITPQKIGCEKTGNSRDVINRRPKRDL